MTPEEVQEDLKEEEHDRLEQSGGKEAEDLSWPQIREQEQGWSWLVMMEEPI